MKKSNNRSQELTLFPSSSEYNFSVSTPKETDTLQKQENDSCRIVSFESFKHKQDGELRNKFYSLSDHLD